MDISSILRSSLFGLPSVLSKYMQLQLNRKRFLQFRVEQGTASSEEINEHTKVEKEIKDSGFNDATYDPWYNRYLEEISENPLFQQVEFTDAEEQELKALSKKIIEKLTKTHLSDETHHYQ